MRGIETQRLLTLLTFDLIFILVSQVRSYTEHFRSKCNDIISWLSQPNYFPGFTEGWATYVEYPLLANDTDIYSNTTNKNVLLQKYGMLKYQVITITHNNLLWCCGGKAKNTKIWNYAINSRTVQLSRIIVLL